MSWRKLWATCLLAVVWLPANAQKVTYIHTDALGSVVAVTDQNRNVIERREYEPYGQQLTPAVQDGPGYTGHVQDAATGLVYMQQRYYDPGIGMMLSVDPVTAYEKPITNFCRYCYARNNPYLFTDPDGRDGSPFSMARADARIRELEASDPKAARTAQIQGYSAATGILFGPLVAWQAGMAALANPGAVTIATDVAAGAAGVTGAAGAAAVAGKITGYTRHGLNQAISRDAGKGVSPRAILSAVRSPTKVAEQAGGKTAYANKDAKVVLNSEGKVVTTIPRNSEALRDKVK